MTVAALLVLGLFMRSAEGAVVGNAPVPDTAPFAVPSGAEVAWQDTIEDVPGPAGLTYRYRFVMPELSSLVPTTEGPADEVLSEADMAELDRLGSTDDGGLMDMGPIDNDPEAEAELVSPEDLDLPDFEPADFTDPTDEAAADAAMGVAGAEGLPPPLPPDPSLLLQDPVHEDIVWLCEQWILPRLAAPAPLPAQIIISLADRPTVFGEIDMQAVQLFEAFSISADRQSCVWQAW